MKTLGELIRTARLAQNWTQRELAEQMNVSRSAVSNWENERLNRILLRFAVYLRSCTVILYLNTWKS